MLQHVVNMRHLGEHDISRMIISGLQSLEVLPGVHALFSFAESHLPMSAVSSDTAYPYGLITHNDLDQSGTVQPSSAYSVERRRAKMLAALENVRPYLTVCGFLNTTRKHRELLHV
jgi:hypothetical protein